MVCQSAWQPSSRPPAPPPPPPLPSRQVQYEDHLKEKQKERDAFQARMEGRRIKLTETEADLRKRAADRMEWEDALSTTFRRIYPCEAKADLYDGFRAASFQVNSVATTSTNVGSERAREFAQELIRKGKRTMSRDRKARDDARAAPDTVVPLSEYQSRTAPRRRASVGGSGEKAPAPRARLSGCLDKSMQRAKALYEPSASAVERVRALVSADRAGAAAGKAPRESGGPPGLRKPKKASGARPESPGSSLRGPASPTKRRSSPRKGFVFGDPAGGADRVVQEEAVVVKDLLDLLPAPKVEGAAVLRPPSAGAPEPAAKSRSLPGSSPGPSPGDSTAAEAAEREPPAAEPHATAAAAPGWPLQPKPKPQLQKAHSVPIPKASKVQESLQLLQEGLVQLQRQQQAKDAEDKGGAPATSPHASPQGRTAVPCHNWSQAWATPQSTARQSGQARLLLPVHTQQDQQGCPPQPYRSACQPEQSPHTPRLQQQQQWPLTPRLQQQHQLQMLPQYQPQKQQLPQQQQQPQQPEPLPQQHQEAQPDTQPPPQPQQQPEQSFKALHGASSAPLRFPLYMAPGQSSWPSPSKQKASSPVAQSPKPTRSEAFVAKTVMPHTGFWSMELVL